VGVLGVNGVWRVDGRCVYVWCSEEVEEVGERVLLRICIAIAALKLRNRIALTVQSYSNCCAKASQSYCIHSATVLQSLR
jgi:hypothetical protein